MKQQEKIIVAMSGGVDSSVSALLLCEQGYEVEGLFMKNWEEDDTDSYCAAADDRADAEAICDKLGIKLNTVNFAAEYWDNVFEHFLQEYSAGRTPNPDVLCNREIKFKAMLDYALSLGADKMATGHYARIAQANNQATLLRGLDTNKDQSYFLYMVNQQALQKSVFPIGELEKPKVREIAKQHDLITHNKKDSTGICFIGERRFKTFLEQYVPAKPGLIKTPEGDTVGEHEGVMYYTLGQRKGLGIGGRHDAEDNPWYVLAKDVANNVLYVGQGHDHPWLFADVLDCNQLHWIAGTPPSTPLCCTAKTRYRQADQTCTLEQVGDDQFQVRFDQAQRAITPGQSVVFYQDEICLGGGIITGNNSPWQKILNP